MNIYHKINIARRKFHQLKLKKTGNNTFAKYMYWELGDFLVPALDIFNELGLCGIVTFNHDFAVLEIHDVDDLSIKLVISSPMGSAALKGCHEVQNIGAVETYQRRYLWMAALELVEHDSVEQDLRPDTDAFEAEWLPKLRDASLNGMEALQAAFKAIPNGEAKSKLWATHSKSLKEAANGAA